MWKLISLLLFMPLTWLTAAAVVSPTVNQTPARGFSLPVAPKNDAKRDFVRDWAAVRHKWGGGVPKDSSMFSLLENEGRVDVDPLGSDDIYIANIEIGTPPQRLRIALDTGSADLWIQSADTIYRANKKGPYAPQYKPNASETAHLVDDAKWALQYLDGTTASGIVYHDTVHIGGFTVENATVQSALKVAARFEDEDSLSGIMGLAKRLPSNVEPEMPSFISMLKKHLDHPVFTVDLKKNASGRFDFGYINKSLAVEDLAWVDTDPKSPHWDIQLELTSWDGVNASWYYQPFMATIDTGTTLMFLPDNLASMYWFAVPGMKVESGISNSYTFPCEVADQLPDLWFKVPRTERVLHIPGPYLNYGPTDDDPTYCWGGMQSAEGLDVTVLGDIMLKALFVAFDLEKNRVGFANKLL
ncbi:Endothiapepsin [Cladobotryum mycophilum]|uniref:Endothiapepsin n=1 Tax=Cladobotryum mycophilum TaxID=491253 RepID=A0ABR0SZW2_9HYPO